MRDFKVQIYRTLAEAVLSHIMDYLYQASVIVAFGKP